MAGVVLTTSVVTGPTTLTISPTSTLFVAGVTERGPEGEAFLCQSLSDYQDIFGGYVSTGYVHQTVQTFFEEGGSRVYVSRVIDQSAAVAASATITAATSGTALTIVAGGEGTWANTMLDAQVATTAGGFRIRILLDDEVVYSTPVVTTTAEAIEELTSSDLARAYVYDAVVGAGSGLPAAGTYAFSGGTNGSTLIDADYTAALGAFVKTLGTGAVCIPGSTGNSVWTALMGHAKANNRIALLGFDKEDTVAGAISDAASLASSDGAEFSAWYYPWVRIVRDGVASTIPCEGYVAAKRAKTHNELGSWNPYAGVRTNSDFVTGTYATITSAQADALNDGGVNPIRVIAGDVRIYGARSASSDTDNYRFINSREVVNYVVSESESVLEDLVFSVIDGRGSLFGAVMAALTSVVAPLAQAGGLYPLYNSAGKLVDSGYKVTVNEALNPVTQLASGTIKARVGLRVSSIGETIEVEISKSNLTASLA